MTQHAGKLKDRLIRRLARGIARRVLLALFYGAMGMFLAVLVCSTVFALLHYDVINPAGTPFDWPSFFIRFLASVFFCVVFLTRGFGVAVGTHAAYDVLTQI